jgi:hypothetical protein
MLPVDAGVAQPAPDGRRPGRLAQMDPWDRLDELLDGVDCAVCQGAVPVARIRLLAQREEMAFVELDCASCGSVSLGILVAPHERDGGPGPRAGSHGELSPEEAARFDHSPPVGPEDVERMSSFLAGYRGGLRELLHPADGSGDSTTSHGR